MGVDFSGGPVIDPTENVISLVNAESKRQDDLRNLTVKYLDERFTAQENLAKLHVEYAKEIRTQAAAATTALSQSTANTAEVLRSTLTSTAQAMAAQTASTVSTINERLSTVERALAEGRGKEAVADPMMTELVREIKSLRESRASEMGKTMVTDPALVQLAREVRELVTARAAEAGVRTVSDPAMVQLLEEVHRNTALLTSQTGKSEGIGASWGILLGVIGFVATILAIIGGTLALMPSRSSGTDAAIIQLTNEVKAMRDARSAAPSVVYVPASPLLPTSPTSPTPQQPNGNRQ